MHRKEVWQPIRRFGLISFKKDKHPFGFGSSDVMICCFRLFNIINRWILDVWRRHRGLLTLWTDIFWIKSRESLIWLAVSVATDLYRWPPSCEQRSTRSAPLRGRPDPDRSQTWRTQSSEKATWLQVSTLANPKQPPGNLATMPFLCA